MRKKFDIRMIGAFAAAVGLVMMICGAVRGESGVVLQKAVRICLECIGIG